MQRRVRRPAVRSARASDSSPAAASGRSWARALSAAPSAISAARPSTTTSEEAGMRGATTIGVLGLLAVASSAQAQVPSPTSFDQAVYVTCREAQAMQPEARKRLAIMLAEHSARYRGVALPNDERG